MRSLVLVPIFRRPQASGHHGTHLAYLQFLIGYYLKDKRFRLFNQFGFRNARCMINLLRIHNVIGRLTLNIQDSYYHKNELKEI